MKKKKNMNHMFLSIDVEKPFDKVKHPFLVQTLNKVGKEGTYLNIIKAIYEISLLIQSSLGKNRVLPLWSETRQGGSHSPSLFNVVMEVLASANNKKK